MWQGQDPIGAVVLEIQRQHDPDKRSSWPLYTAALHAKHGGLLKTYLLVIATNRQTAQWAQQPIATCQPHAPFRPLVLGPDDVGRLDSEEAARADLPLAMLSAVLHVNDHGGAVDAAHALRATEAVAGTESAVWLYGLLRGLVDDERATNPARSGNAITTTPASLTVKPKVKPAAKPRRSCASCLRAA